MKKKGKKVCVCGGGGLGTVIAGFSAFNGYEVNVLTGRPEHWKQQIEVEGPLGQKYVGRVRRISSEAEDVISRSEIIILCVPGSIIHSELEKIKPYISEKAVVGCVFSCTGFFISAISVLGEKARLFGFQRVPFIARVKEYGRSAIMLDNRKSLNLAFWGLDNAEKEATALELEQILATPIQILPHALQATLTNSNPILHPCRLYSLFKDFDISQPFEKIPRFYEDWTDDSSRILIECDNEFQLMLSMLGLKSKYTPPLLEYYDSHDAESLTRKITSIRSLKGLLVPMIKVEGGYAPDWENRYFTEDIPYGMLLIRFICQEIGLKTPVIDKIIMWYQTNTGKKYLENGVIAQSLDVASIGCLKSDVLKLMFSML